MDRKRILIVLTAVFGVTLLALIAAMFGKSLAPNSKAYASLPSFEIPQLKPGEFELRKHPLFTQPNHGRDENVFIYRKLDGTFRFWSLATYDGKIAMPDVHWWRAPAGFCSNFGPTVVNGQVDESKPIRCHDDDVPSYWADYWVWDIEGKNIGRSGFDDMIALPGVVEGNLFLLGASTKR
jgi:hypothetical protein